VFEPSRRAITNSSRQYGKSHGTAGAGVLWGAFNGELTTIISKGQLESDEVLDKAIKHAKVLQSLGSRMAEHRKRGTELVFASGGRILAAPSTGGRGFSGNLFLDELAYHDHPQDVWDAAMPVTMRSNYRVRLASTPNGAGNIFHELWTTPAKRVGYVRHEIPLKVALDEGLKVDLLHCWAMAKGDPRLFGQMFNCEFLDGHLQYIPTQSVTDAASANCYAHGAEYYAGLDIGRTNDRTVLIVVAFDGLRAIVQAIQSCKRTEHQQLQELVDEAFSRYPIRRLAVDETGLGAFPVDDMRRRHGRRKVEGVQFTLQSKEDLATTLYDAFAGWSGDGELESRGWVVIPQADGVLEWDEAGAADRLQKDVCSIKRIVTSAGNIRYDAERTDEGHADSAWALALALHAINNRPARKVITP
jgi:phage FluMu gp28-like protein